MRVTLARPYDGHQPDETIDLPAPEARRLLRDGKARAAGVHVPDLGRPRLPAESTYVGPVPPSDAAAYAGPTPDAPDAGEGDAS